MSVFVRHHATYMYFDKDAWVILDPIEQSIRAKIEKYGTPLRDWDIAINYGIKTGCNEAFIIDGAKRAELIAADPKSDEIIRPILRGKDIKRYGYDFDDKWLINIECGFTNSNRGNMKPEVFIKSTYPAVYQHFTDVANRPTKGKGLVDRDDKGDYWWELRSCAYMNDFYKQKIVYPCIMAQEPCFMLDEDQHFPPAPGNIITGQHLKYLLGFLCSKVCYFALREFYMGGGIEGELKTNRLLILPVPRPSENESLFDELVSNLIENKQVGADISLLDNQIEKLVVEAYHLTDEEVDFIHKKIVCS